MQAIISLRFLKFCTVGASGVVVNLGLLALFADGFGVQVNLASAIAIEASINSNFMINEMWTFRDRRTIDIGPLRRLAKFHMVAIVGALVQWGVFIMANNAWLTMLGGHAADPDTAVSLLTRYLVHPILHPPEVGNLKYVSSLLGIGAATFWNYLVNFHWTWGQSERKSNHG